MKIKKLTALLLTVSMLTACSSAETAKTGDTDVQQGIVNTGDGQDNVTEGTARKKEVTGEPVPLPPRELPFPIEIENKYVDIPDDGSEFYKYYKESEELFLKGDYNNSRIALISARKHIEKSKDGSDPYNTVEISDQLTFLMGLEDFKNRQYSDAGVVFENFVAFNKDDPDPFMPEECEKILYEIQKYEYGYAAGGLADHIRSGYKLIASDNKGKISDKYKNTRIKLEVTPKEAESNREWSEENLTNYVENHCYQKLPFPEETKVYFLIEFGEEPGVPIMLLAAFDDCFGEDYQNFRFPELDPEKQNPFGYSFEQGYTWEMFY